MATNIKAGLYQPDPYLGKDEDLTAPEVYIDELIVQINTPDGDMVAQFTYEELRGIMAIMAAEQEKQHLYIKALSRNN
ncbi:hypothetical protein EB118_12755 [bacterium]|nr:hypothetical protein [bacterium]NDD82944.1 hypothetical protein [bacterium]NDG30930.1 hypothetical protein [bacterium]